MTTDRKLFYCRFPLSKIVTTTIQFFELIFELLASKIDFSQSHLPTSPRSTPAILTK